MESGHENESHFGWNMYTNMQNVYVVFVTVSVLYCSFRYAPISPRRKCLVNASVFWFYDISSPSFEIEQDCAKVLGSQENCETVYLGRKCVLTVKMLYNIRLYTNKQIV